MSYIALVTVRLGKGKTVAPGETLPPLPEREITELLAVRAVREAEPAQAAKAETEQEAAPEQAHPDAPEPIKQPASRAKRK
ncbi:MAG: hypothetical protein LBE22_07635 [Azoarcus sp.]|jgi:hypothetical protein|nr:hypothetical protein [Azoarcus sp.]